MEKGIYLEAQLHVGDSTTAASKVAHQLPEAFSKVNPGLQLTVKHTGSADANGNATIRVYIQGDQDPAADFAALTRDALSKAIAAVNTSVGSPSTSSAVTPGSAAPASGHRHGYIRVNNIKEVQVDDDDGGLVLPPKSQPTPSSAPTTAASSAANPSPEPSAPPTTSPSTSTTHPPWWAFWRRGKT